MSKFQKALTALISTAILLTGSQAFAAWSNQTVAGTNVRIYTPSTNASIGSQRGLLIVLHGCGQANSVYQTAKLDTAAENWGLVIALPQGNNLGGISGDCWKYWSDSGQSYSRNTGDYKRVIDVANTIRGTSSYNIDANQVYVAGLSSGAAFANTLGCLAPDVFAGIGIMAGPSIGTTANGALGTFENANVESRCNSYAGTYNGYFDTQIANFSQGDGDYTVSQNYLNQNVNGFAGVYGVSQTSSGTVTIDGKSITKTVYGNGKLVKMKMAGVGHAWPGGAGASGSYITSNSANYGNILGEYFVNNNLRAAGGTGGGDTGGGDTGGGDTGGDTGGGDTGGGTGSSACEKVTGTGDSLASQGLVRIDYNVLAYSSGDNVYLGINTANVSVYKGSDGKGYNTDPMNCAGGTGGDTGGGDTGGGDTGGGDTGGGDTGGSACLDEQTNYNYYHKTAGRAYSSGNYWTPNYFAKGSAESMAGSTWGTTTLHTFDGSVWHVGACP